jgi:starch synthase (maltosyl-transferring)
MIGRFPIVDISPTIYFGGEFVGAKAIVHESFPISATILREGHEGFSARVLLLDPKGKEFSAVELQPLWPGGNRFEAWVSADRVGEWRFRIEVTAQNPGDFARELRSTSEEFPIKVESERALVGSWYEFFPRSEGAVMHSDGSIRSGTFLTAAERIPDIAGMGFDVLYLPPIHPIGYSHRKGRNNSLTAQASDPGVPWGIGNELGGHDSINPELGTMEDFRNFLKVAKKNKIEVALDLALQCSPDHPWVKSNPEWFTKRADGTIAYAENPPKKYQDIFPINFDNDYPGLFAEVYRIVEFWIQTGIKIFRVDNPHTKPVHFWQELLNKVNKEYPEVVFLSEAFTNPEMMHTLGKAGFQQSYTYFTWRVTKKEITDYAMELSHQSAHFFRPNLWVNTPDILPTHLQSGNPAIFALRALLASTLSPSWGMYAGYELYEHIPLEPGTEEYLNSEKYEIKIRDWDKAAEKGLSLAPFITQLNEIRRLNPALRRLRNLYFHPTQSDQIIAYSKREGDNLILVVINLDSVNQQETLIHWDLARLGVSEESFQVIDLLDKKSYQWSKETYVKLNPARPDGKIAHICQLISL